MKIFLTVISFLIFCFNAKSQIDKGVWLVGGTGKFQSLRQNYTSPTFSFSSDKLNIGIAPNIGYFIADRLAIGLKLNYTKFKDQVNGAGGANSDINRFSFGPLARYYFLNKERRYNILTEIDYQYGLYSFKPTKGNNNTFNAAIGPVVYFNTTVGLEFLVGYYSTAETIKQSGDIKTKQSGVQIGIGFQIHLEN